MSRHDGVSCDSCLKSNFPGRRYKCLICYDYDLCSRCYDMSVFSSQNGGGGASGFGGGAAGIAGLIGPGGGSASSSGNPSNPRHSASHPMQCILTRQDRELFYGGETSSSSGSTNASSTFGSSSSAVDLGSSRNASFACPFCGKFGYTETSLISHVNSEHVDSGNEVVCPICASLPGGDPNHVTDNFVDHLRNEHGASTTTRASVGGGGSGNSNGTVERTSVTDRPPRDLISFLESPNSGGSAGGGLSNSGSNGGGSGADIPVTRPLSDVRRVRNRMAAAASRARMHGGNGQQSNSANGGSLRGLGGYQSSSSSRSTAAASAGEVDPIAELLSQLSSVRRSMGGTSSYSQLHRLQMQLQMERNQHLRQQQMLSPLTSRGPLQQSPSSTASARMRSSASISRNSGGPQYAVMPPPSVSNLDPSQQQQQTSLNPLTSSDFFQSGLTDSFGGSGQQQGMQPSYANITAGASAGSGGIEPGWSSDAPGTGMTGSSAVDLFSMNSGGAAGGSGGGPTGGTNGSRQAQRHQFLLRQYSDEESDGYDEGILPSKALRSLFVQDLVLSSLLDRKLNLSHQLDDEVTGGHREAAASEEEDCEENAGGGQRDTTEGGGGN